MRVGIITGENHGTNYYRGTLVKRYIDRMADGGIEAYHVCAWNDIFLSGTDVFFLLRPSPDVLPIEKIHLLKRRNYPIIVDADDQIFDIPLWSPSSTTFKKKSVLDYYRAVYRAADMITTPSMYLQDSFINLGIVPPDTRFEHIPNAFDTSLKLLRPQVTEPGIPNIGWSGGGQHQEDLSALEPVFVECLRRGYGLTFLGDAPRCIDGLEKQGARIQVVQGSQNVELYMQIMPILGIDVGLAPLLDIEFNRCKSGLKPTEYRWLCGVPVVASDLPCYNEHDESAWIRKLRGFDVSGWMAAIEDGIRLVRREGRKYELSSCYRMDDVVHSWVKAFRAARAAVAGA